MVGQKRSRRKMLSTGSALMGVGLAGCTGSGGDGDGSDEPPNDVELKGKDPSFTLRPEGPGIDFELLVDIDGEYVPEGLAYRDGHLYTGERDGPATIREFDTEGNLTGEEFTFDDRRIDHTNTMDWVDGNLWVSDSSTMKTYVVDWDDEEVIDEFDHGGPVTGTWRVIVPTSAGERKLVFNEWLGSRVWVVDLEDAVEDGTTRGNVERELRNGFWTDPQTMAWHDGALYTTTHSWVVKSRLPYVDQLNDGYPLTSYNVEWAFEFEDGMKLEQMVLDPDSGEFYLADRGGLGTIYRGREAYGEHRNASFAAWDTTGGGFGADAVIRVDETRIESLELTRGDGQQKVGWVDVWFYDTDSDETEVGVGVVTHQNDTFGLGIWSEDEFGTNRYARYDGDEWVDSSVERIPGAWVKFGWSIQENSVRAYVSPNYGQSWEEAGVERRDNATVERLRIRHRSGVALVGNWTLDLQNADLT